MHPKTAPIPKTVNGEESDMQGLADVIAYAVSEEKTRRAGKKNPDESLTEENVVR